MELDEFLFGEKHLWRTLQFLDINATEVLEQLKVNEAIGLDGLDLFDYRFTCNLKNSAFNLDICGDTNPGRKYGTRVAPIGGFVNQGTFFCYHQMPSGEQSVLMQKFKPLGAGFFTSSDIHVTCAIKVEPTPDGIFRIAMKDETFVATTHKKYILRQNGSDFYAMVPESGQFFGETAPKVVHPDRKHEDRWTEHRGV